MAKLIYYNRNPDGNKESDCVTRAISLASGLPYSSVRKKLYHMSELLNCEKLCVCCYRHLLDDIFKYPRVECEGYTVEEFADMHPQGSYLVRMSGHITTIIDGNIWDIFNCGKELCTDAWLVKQHKSYKKIMKNY